MRFVAYGDFNCPYSALASRRVDQLQDRGLAEVEWRAVQHDEDMPPDGAPVEGELREELERELEKIRGLLRPGEELRLEIMDVRPNTAPACGEYAAASEQERDELRRQMFDTVWCDGRSPDKGMDRRGHPLASEWQREWKGFEERMVPLLVFPNGEVSRGVDALKRLADLEATGA